MVLSRECPYCGNDRGNTYYCSHCSAPKDFIMAAVEEEKVSFPLLETLKAEKLAAELFDAEPLVVARAETIVEQTVAAMDVARETFPAYSKTPIKTSRSRRKRGFFAFPTGQVLGFMFTVVVLVAMFNFSAGLFDIESMPEDNIDPPIYVSVYVTLVNSTDYAYYKGFAHFTDEEGEAWSTFGGGTQERGYNLFALFCAGERVLVCINISDKIDENYPYSFTVPADWTEAWATYYVGLTV